MRAIYQKVEHTCPFCDETYFSKKGSKTCGKNSCKYQSRKMPIEDKTCPTCCKMFKPTRNSQKYCSKRCQCNSPDNYIDSNCESCGKHFHYNSAWSDGSRFCSPECRAYGIRGNYFCMTCGDRYRLSVKWGDTSFCSSECIPEFSFKTCESCFEDFVLDNPYSTRRFCSNFCKRQSSEDVVCECKRCTKLFRSPSGVPRSFCSDECSWKFYKKPILSPGTVICVECGSEQWFKDRSGARSFCSSKCSRKFHGRNSKHRRRVRTESGPNDYISKVDLRQRDGDHCGICNRVINFDLEFPHPLCATVDHVIPLAKGGSHTKSNCQLAHFICNMKKSDKLPLI